jgi:hypothetical protein
MALENVIAYAVVLGLPLWLVAEEIVHRIAPRLKGRERGAPAFEGAATPAPTSLERRAPEGAPVHAHVSLS